MFTQNHNTALIPNAGRRYQSATRQITRRTNVWTMICRGNESAERKVRIGRARSEHRISQLRPEGLGRSARRSGGGGAYRVDSCATEEMTRAAGRGQSTRASERVPLAAAANAAAAPLASASVGPRQKQRCSARYTDSPVIRRLQTIVSSPTCCSLPLRPLTRVRRSLRSVAQVERAREGRGIGANVIRINGTAFPSSKIAEVAQCDVMTRRTTERRVIGLVRTAAATSHLPQRQCPQS